MAPLVVIILCLVAGMILLMMSYKMHSGISEVNKDEVCRLSIFSASALSSVKEGTHDVIDLVNKIDCPRKKLHIGLDDVSKRGKIQDDFVKEIIGNEMVSCWNKVGAGKLDPFKGKQEVKDTFCLICSKIMFDNDFLKKAKKQNYSFVGFDYYIATKRVPGTSMFINEYLGGERSSVQDLQKLKISPASNKGMNFANINDISDHVVVWRVEKYSPDTSIWGYAKKFTAGLVLGAAGIIVIGATGGVARVVIGVAGVSAIISGSDEKLLQQTFLVPEDYLSQERDVGGEKQDFCTVMLN